MKRIYEIEARCLLRPMTASPSRSRRPRRVFYEAAPLPGWG